MSRISFRLQSLKSNSHRQSLILLAVLISACALLVCSSASNSSTTPSESPRVQNKTQRPRGCPSCPPPSPRRIYAPAIELNEARTCEIVLNSRSAQPIDVTPTFYTASGDAVVGNPIQLQPAEIRFVPVEQLMPEYLRGQHRWGGIALSYTGNVLEVWAQITFHGIGGGSIDETFNILEEPGSDTREAVWLMTRKSTAMIALGNSSSTAIHTTAQFGGGASEDFEIPAGVTRFVRHHAQGGKVAATPESVKLTTVGPEGALRVAGFMVGDDDDFASSIRFYDTKKTVQPNLYAVNLRLKNAMPRMVLKNTSDNQISAQPRFFSAAGEQGSPVDLPSLTLRPQQIIDVDLSALRQAAASRTDLDSVSAQIASSGAPGSLIGATYSMDAATGLTYDVPLRDSGKMRNATGSYPWRVDNDYSTIVALTNVGNEPARFQVEIRYSDGPYSIKQRELAVGETVIFDLRQLRDEQQPDRTGKTLPLTLDRGQFHWSIVATHGDPHIIGRAEVVSRSGRVVSSYSCPVCCPDSGPAGHFDPNAYGLSVDGFVYTNAHGDYYDCYYNYYQGSLYFTQMFTYNTSIATVDGGGQLNGIAVGNTDVEGDYDYVEWSNDGMDCYRSYGSGSDSAPVAVAPHINSISPTYGAPGTVIQVSIDGAGFAAGSTVQVTGSGITVGGVIIHSASQITGNFTIAGNASSGTVSVTVTSSGHTSNGAAFSIRVPHHLVVVSDSGNTQALSCQSGAPKIRFLTLKVVDSSGNEVGAVTLQENFTSLSTNTCRADGAGPNPDSCGYNQSGGSTFTDNITVNCNSVNGSCGYTITDQWQWCPSGGSPVTLATLTETVHADQITVNGNTNGLSGSIGP